MKNLTIISIITLLSLVAACNDEDAGDGDTGIGGVGIDTTSRVPSGEVFEHLEGQLPSDFPANFPIYQGAEIARGDTVSDRFAIDLRTQDDMDTVAEYYRAQLNSAGWQLMEETAKAGSVLFRFTSEDGVHEGEVGIGKLQERTWILIAMSRPT